MSTRRGSTLDQIHLGAHCRPLAFDHYFSGRLEAALAEAKKIDMPGFFWNHALLALIYGAMNRKEDARPAVTKLLQRYPEFPRHVRQEGAKWNLTPAQIEQEVRDWRKARLEIPDKD
ncbi:MAG: hypothetical protein ACKVQA_04195 [Burkholderiales bacterium]